MRALTAAGALNVGAHAAGLGLALAGMRQGSPLVPLNDRMAYLASRPLPWTLAWGVWMLCAQEPHLARRALAVCAVGAAVDLFFDVGQMVTLPELAALRPPQPALFVGAIATHPTRLRVEQSGRRCC